MQCVEILRSIMQNSNLIENINQDSDGSIVIKDDNYLLEFMGIKQLCD